MARCVIAVAVGLQLLLLLLLHRAAVVAVGSYTHSFTPQETQKFWTSEGGGNYTFGFKSVGAGDYLLSIWHSLDANQTAIWWADFGENHSSIVNSGASFNYSTSTLQLYDSTSTLIWECLSSFSGRSRTIVQFVDNGNLRLLQENSTDAVWESFQDPRDSLMLVGLEDSLLANNPYLLQSRRSPTSYARGRFHMAITYNGTSQSLLFGLDGSGNQYLYLDDLSLNISDGELLGLQARGVAYKSKRPHLERLSLDYDADLRVYRWFTNNSTWTQVWDVLKYRDGWLQCRAQSPCGPFGLCSVDAAGNVVCSCPIGYEPISSDDPSKGCNSSRTPRGCGDVSGNDTSIMVQQQHKGAINYFYNQVNYFRNVTMDRCKSLCLSECACVAATYLGTKCFLRGNTTTGYLDNGMISPNGTSILMMKLVQVSSPPLKSFAAVKKGSQMQPIIAVAATVGALTLAGCVGFLVWRARGGVVPWSAKLDNEALDGGLVQFRYHELVQATNNFSHLLGEGGYGKVYKGWLSKQSKGLHLSKASAASAEGSMVVAVKMLKQGATKSGEDSQEKKQFKAEAGTLSRIHHVNLVGLLGYCISGRGGEKRLLVYEYMEKGSLNTYLSPTHMPEPLPWSVRLSIAIGTARGIAYLHHHCKPQILHCDIKPQNVLLDEHFTSKVADFGFAERFYRRDQSHLSMSGLRGTFGYMAPEWIKSRKITSKVDVYSFGMLLLELVHGLNTFGNDHMSLTEWAFQCLAAQALLSDHLEPTTLGHVADAAGPPNEIATMPEGNTIDVQPQSSPDDNGEQDSVQQQLHVLRVALWCVQNLPDNRPSMSHVVQLIEGGGNIDNPPDPADATIATTTNILFPNTSMSNNEVTLSVVSPR